MYRINNRLSGNSLAMLVPGIVAAILIIFVVSAVGLDVSSKGQELSPKTSAATQMLWQGAPGTLKG